MNKEKDLMRLLKEERKFAEHVRRLEHVAGALTEIFEVRKQELERKIEVAIATAKGAVCWETVASWLITHCQTQMNQDYRRTKKAHCKAQKARAQLNFIQLSIKDTNKQLRGNGGKVKETPSIFTDDGLDDVVSADMLRCTSDSMSMMMDEDISADAFPNVVPVSVQAAIDAARNESLPPRSLMSYHDSV